MFAPGRSGSNDKLDGRSKSCLKYQKYRTAGEETRKSGVNTKQRKWWWWRWWWWWSSAGSALFWWAQLSQTASADCQPSENSRAISVLFALRAHSQKVIKITSSLLCSSWKYRECERERERGKVIIWCEVKQWRQHTPVSSIQELSGRKETMTKRFLIRTHAQTAPTLEMCSHRGVLHSFSETRFSLRHRSPVQNFLGLSGGRLRLHRGSDVVTFCYRFMIYDLLSICEHELLWWENVTVGSVKSGLAELSLA